MFHIILAKSSKAPAVLNLNALIIFSKLAFAANHAVSASVLARWTRLSEAEVASALAELSALNLVYGDGGGFAPIQPPNSWFIPRRNFKRDSWPYKIAYWTYFPSMTGRLTVEESACWSHMFTTNNITQVVADSHIAEATGISEPNVAKAVATLVQAGLVREIDRLRTAFFDARFGQVLDEGATVAANKRCCIGNAKDKGGDGPEEADVSAKVPPAPPTLPPELRNLDDFLTDFGS